MTTFILDGWIVPAKSARDYRIDLTRNSTDIGSAICSRSIGRMVRRR